MIIHLNGELTTINKFLNDMTSEGYDFLVSQPSIVTGSDGIIAPDTHVEVINILVDLATSITSGIIVGVIQRAAIDRFIREAKDRGLKPRELPNEDHENRATDLD